ncbi:class I SAM-dependent methyltransferase [Stackebrandtia nassauensis]|uniref:Methyltransferase type 11 n=1 Tax=Stackebrandtia nassauensis (strain DSM 44728 / CIP 108903 / NRRL B-16338 / NBRC 102104 / LLR-40K-21) TaxID=446470 RepID=D3Q8F2_STANL|nr:class I SAM-dependent methyltransferase [Stackebrandtia nassauensis]ADD42526.1 Methyltransferase type 11 [Stackebrandtia nassauensis DSM 44728]
MNDSTQSRSAYAFKNSSEESRMQMAGLQAYLDPITTGALDAVGVRAGMRCLELGPGGGSIAHWMCDRVGPQGEVIAVDLNPRHVEPADNLRIVQADIRDGVPVEGQFDVIHTRLCLLHIPERLQIMKVLVDALKPGGWMVIGEFTPEPLRVISTPGEAASELWHKVNTALFDGITNLNGADMNWSYQVHDTMLEHGLIDVHHTEHNESWDGGEGIAARMHYTNSIQLAEPIKSCGVTDAELEEFRALTENPEFRATHYQFINTRGRKPLS